MMIKDKLKGGGREDLVKNSQQIPYIHKSSRKKIPKISNATKNPRCKLNMDNGSE